MTAFLNWLLSLFADAGASPASASATTANMLLPMTKGDRWATVRKIIDARIATSKDKSGFYKIAAYLMADMENGIAEGMLSPVFQQTNSLFNRHVGEAQVGVRNSNGVWNGRVFFASAKDPNLRMYDSLEDSVDDFLQLMGRPIYREALAAGLAHDLPRYIKAVAKAGYSAQASYEAILTARARHLGIS